MASAWTRLAAAASVVLCLVTVTFFATNTSGASPTAQPVALSAAPSAPEPTPVPEVTVAPEPPPAPVTVAPAPEPAAPPLAVAVAVVREPDPEPAPVEEPAPAQSATERCSAGRQWVAAHGLSLPAGFAFRCPDPAIFADGGSRWGTTCWNCGAPGGSYIAINIDRIGSSDDVLHHVIAHETCHAIQDVTTGMTTEESADACAAAHGA